MANVLSRRDFMVRGALGGGAAWVASRFPRAWAAAAEDDEPAVLRGADRKTVEAIAGRILPRDEEPGAVELGCVKFIDKALVHEESAARDVYVAGLAGLRALAQTRFAASFVELSADQQDELLAALDSDEIAEWPSGAGSPKRFFDTVRRHTLLGALADPKHGGNREWAGWRLAGYPAPLHRAPHSAAQLAAQERVIPVWERPRFPMLTPPVPDEESDRNA